MKKLIFFFSFLTMVMVSCQQGPDVNDPNEYCWEIKASASYMGVSGTSSTYVWGTGEDVADAIDLIEEQYKFYEQAGYKIDITPLKTNKSEAACSEM